MFQQITIVGVGLIGGSFGLAVRKHGFHGRIVGCDRDPVLHAAVERGAIDAAIPDPIEACRRSQLVMLATPVGGIIDLIERIGPTLPANVVLTDVGSTKADIGARARQVFGGRVAEQFVAGHPMAGKERSGIDEADPDLFQNAPWFLVPTPGQNLLSGRMNDFVVLLETIGARIVTLDAATHDRLCAWTSHLPQMVAIALAATLVDEFGAVTQPTEPRHDELNSSASSRPRGEIDLLSIHSAAGRQLREMTRTGASPYSMWRDVAFTNTANLADALQRLEQRLAHIRENLRGPELRREFEKANSFAERKQHPPQRHRDTENK